MALRLSRRSIPLLALAASAAACGPGAGPAAAGGCDRVAAPGGSDRGAGTAAAPFRTAQRLADTLRPGQTGCLRGGVYAERTREGYVLRFGHGGRAGAPVRIQSFPGERAKLAGVVYVPPGSDHVTLADVDIDDRTGPRGQLTVQVMASDTTLDGLDVTNRSDKTCVLLGKRGWGRALRPVVRNSVLHQCGDRARGMLDHAIYVGWASGAEIAGNVIWGSAAYAVHLYPEADDSRVTGNIMVANGGGVIFAGEGGSPSSGNLVERNVIAGSIREPNLRAYWGGRAGTRNVARSNCLYRAGGENVARQIGFTAESNVMAAPAFADAARHDYRLTGSGSCLRAVGAGIAARAAAAARAGSPGAPAALRTRRACGRRRADGRRRSARARRACKRRRAGVSTRA